MRKFPSGLLTTSDIGLRASLLRQFGRMSIAGVGCPFLVKRLWEDPENDPRSGYSEDHQWAPRARRSQPPHIRGCIEGGAAVSGGRFLVKSDHKKLSAAQHVRDGGLEAGRLGPAARECFNTASHNRSGLSSSAFASSMIR
jgi:hypothetical protein